MSFNIAKIIDRANLPDDWRVGRSPGSPLRYQYSGQCPWCESATTLELPAQAFTAFEPRQDGLEPFVTIGIAEGRDGMVYLVLRLEDGRGQYWGITSPCSIGHRIAEFDYFCHRQYTVPASSVRSMVQAKQSVQFAELDITLPEHPAPKPEVDTNDRPLPPRFDEQGMVPKVHRGWRAKPKARHPRYR